MAAPSGESWRSASGLVLRIHRRYLDAALAAYGRGRALDLGCGARPYADLLAGRVRACLGLEPDRRRYRQTPPEVWGSGLDLPFAAASFDTVLAAQVLEHLPEPARACGEIARVLAPGGHLVLTAPLMWGVHEEPGDYYRFTTFGLAHLAGQAGLEVVEVRAMAGYWVTAGARLCYYLQRLERHGLRRPLGPVYAVVQALALVLDRLDRVEGDTWNSILVARKPAVPAAP
jgi:SAM-dependent methyltransferase